MGFEIAGFKYGLNSGENAAAEVDTASRPDHHGHISGVSSKHGTEEIDHASREGCGVGESFLCDLLGLGVGGDQTSNPRECTVDIDESWTRKESFPGDKSVILRELVADGPLLLGARREARMTAFGGDDNRAPRLREEYAQSQAGARPEYGARGVDIRRGLDDGYGLFRSDQRCAASLGSKVVDGQE